MTNSLNTYENLTITSYLSYNIDGIVNK